MPINGISHVSITVADLERSKSWYAEVLGWTPLMDDRSDTTTFSYGTLPDGTTIVLRVHDEPADAVFDERRVGLDHLSLSVTDADARVVLLASVMLTLAPAIGTPAPFSVNVVA